MNSRTLPELYYQRQYLNIHAALARNRTVDIPKPNLAVCKNEPTFPIPFRIVPVPILPMSVPTKPVRTIDELSEIGFGPQIAESDFGHDFYYGESLGD